ncbi:sialate O-acetylesterase [Paenibacillus methanolicus]|uniref:Sialate O-acetylesterase domain-containing protein n=1 Tax=Paenibacillus methanolicus TaxID=582686 RepID=A0A5S5BKS6_9BACL|nr:sialate O-acetylesterase [Paenibacillus methanolicus]TYP67679.1 protein of unknown function (DUF303) [Paenibacillus methanolicus]
MKQPLGVSRRELVTEPIDMFLSAGQSNEVGKGDLNGKETGIPEVTVFGGDYKWRQLEEPAYSGEGHIDAISDNGTWAGHSSLLRFGKSVYAATGKPISIVTAAKGSTSTTQWYPYNSERFDRGSLFGSADFRVNQALKGGRVLRGILWMQGESDSLDSSKFISRNTTIINKFKKLYGSDIPVFYSQLATHVNATNNAQFQVIREMQRKMETGSGDASAIPGHYMIVTHDLGIDDGDIHMNKEAELIMGDRRALAVLERYYKLPVNGTGPRLVGISKPTATTIKVKTTRSINDHNTYENFFKVYDNGAAATISSISRDPGDNTAVRITLAAAPAGTVTVEFGPPARARNVRLFNCVQDADGLPLPAFGPLGLF